MKSNKIEKELMKRDIKEIIKKYKNIGKYGKKLSKTMIRRWSNILKSL